MEKIKFKMVGQDNLDDFLAYWGPILKLDKDEMIKQGLITVWDEEELFSDEEWDYMMDHRLKLI
jgi:hypothetical protein